MQKRDQYEIAFLATAWVFVILLLVFIIGFSYSIAKSKGKTERHECTPQPQKSAYDMSPRQLKRMIRYELAKGKTE